MNNRKKGQRAELELKRMLEAEGYTVEKVKIGSVFGEKDFFGLFDLIAFNSVHWKLVQVKCNTKRGQQEILAWMKERGPPAAIAVLAVRHDHVPSHQRWTFWQLRAPYERWENEQEDVY